MAAFLVMVFMVNVLLEVVTIAMASVADVGQTENGSGYGRLVGKSPGLAAIVRGCRIGGGVCGQVTASHHTIPRVAKSHREPARAGRTD